MSINIQRWSNIFYQLDLYVFICNVKRSKDLTLQIMKKIAKNISPFLLLLLPFFVAVLFMAIHSGAEMIQERIQLSASFIQLPQIDVMQVLFRW